MLQSALLLKNKFLIVLYCTINAAVGQVNLVPNFDFENFSSCPSNVCQLSLAIPWTAPTNDDADLYNGCSSLIYGFQCAYSGIGYAGIFSYNWSGLNYREYIQVQLDTNLQSNTCYLVNFYVNLKGGGIRYATNNLGLYLSDTGFSFIALAPFGPPLNVIPQIIKYNNPIIKDTVNWIPVSGIYVANGGEEFITIGNFFNDVNTDTLATNNGTYPGAYYNIDYVSVIAIDSSFTVWEYKDTTVYAGDSVFIGQELTGLNCTWYDTSGNVLANNVPGIYVSPTTTTNYIVVENLCGSIRTDTVKVTVNYIGIKEEQALQNSILYPNPAMGSINIVGFKKEISHVTIYLTDLNGRKIFNRNVTVINGTMQIELDVANGTYLLYITLPNSKERTIKKVVIQK